MTHTTALSNSDAKDNISQREDSRNHKCGMNPARTSYYILNNGHPTSDFTELLSMQHSNSCDIGDIDHSFNFVNKVAGSFSNVITSSVRLGRGMFILVIFVEYVENSPKRCEKPITRRGG